MKINFLKYLSIVFAMASFANSAVATSLPEMAFIVQGHKVFKTDMDRSEVAAKLRDIYTAPIKKLNAAGARISFASMVLPATVPGVVEYQIVIESTEDLDRHAVETFQQSVGSQSFEGTPLNLTRVTSVRATAQLSAETSVDSKKNETIAKLQLPEVDSPTALNLRAGLPSLFEPFWTFQTDVLSQVAKADAGDAAWNEFYALAHDHSPVMGFTAHMLMRDELGEEIRLPFTIGYLRNCREKLQRDCF